MVRWKLYKMELTSKYFNIDLTVSELIKLIPSKTWDSIESQILTNAKKEYSEAFTDISFVDSEGKISFGVST